MAEIWFWQRIVSPHMAGLAASVAALGYEVTYVAEQELSDERVRLGWSAPELHEVKLRFLCKPSAIDKMLSEASANSIHICQGIRGNGKVSKVQRVLTRRGLRQWLMMETVDDAGAVGVLKRWEYGRLLCGKGRSLEGVLAIGHTTADWIQARGIAAELIYPFAYFLSNANLPKFAAQRENGPFRFLFVGQFIERKRFDLLISSLKMLQGREFELIVVGSGKLERPLRVEAERALAERVRWLGGRPMAEVRSIMREVDCLVLPSRHDGWGAVISEALMAGTPVICSDACGSAGVVKISHFGGVFAGNQIEELQLRLDEQLQIGPILPENRMLLANWAKALGADAGARYLMDIISYVNKGGIRPTPPWCVREG